MTVITRHINMKFYGRTGEGWLILWLDFAEVISNLKISEFIYKDNGKTYKMEHMIQSIYKFNLKKILLKRNGDILCFLSIN